MLRTIRRWMTARASSVADQRESGVPESRGSVQARALTCARTAEGEKARPAGSGRIPEGRPRPAAPPPLAHRPVGAAHSVGNSRIAPLRMLVGQEQDLRPHHLRLRRGATTAETPELPVFGSREGHLVSRFGSATRPALAPHRTDDSAPASETLKAGCPAPAATCRIITALFRPDSQTEHEHQRRSLAARDDHEQRLVVVAGHHHVFAVTEALQDLADVQRVVDDQHAVGGVL